MTALSLGQYCKPSSEKEWKALLDLADSFGLVEQIPEPANDPYGFDEWPHLQWSGHSVSRCKVFVNIDEPTPVPDFIAGMYAMKEAREKKATGNDADFENHEQRLRKLESSDSFSKAGIFGPLDDLLERVWNLEKALNDRMVKERDCGGAQDYARSQSNTLHSLRNGGKQITFEIGDRKWFAVAHNNGVETLHAPHSGFPIIELEIKEQRP